MIGHLLVERRAAALVMGLLASGNGAWAQGVPNATPEAQGVPNATPEAQARADFDEGVRFARELRWPEALAAFERSRARVDRPNTVFNVAVALRQLGRLLAARQALRECIAMPQTAAEPELARDAALLLGVVADAIARVSLSVEPSDATVRVDGEAVADPRALELDPGEHALTVNAEGHAEEHLTLSLRTGERAVRAVRLRASPSRVDVLVTPADARVYVNEVLLGQGAVRWEGAACTLQLRASRADYADLTRALVVAPGAVMTERLTLSLSTRPLTARPWFWGGIALGVAVVAGVTTAILLSTQGHEVDGGSTGTVLRTP